MFTDAQQMAVDYPHGYKVPSLEELQNIKVGDVVKICARYKERFWVIVTGVEGDVLTGEVNNDLVCTDVHGLRCGDTVVFEKRHIYSIWEEPT